MKSQYDNRSDVAKINEDIDSEFENETKKNTKTL